MRQSMTGKNLGLSALEPDMTILAYTGFSNNYCPMDHLTAKWIKVNFKGASAHAERNGETLRVVVDDLKQGDKLKMLFKFPDSIKKLTQVNQGLIKELEKKGFNQFLVVSSSGSKTEKQIERQKAVQQANGLINQVKESVAVRNEATLEIENTMINIRKGINDIKGISHYVDTIIKSASTDALSAVSSLKKSDQTYAHCVDVGVIFQSVYNKMVEKKMIINRFNDEHESLLAAFMHDIGKSKVPKEILDSTKRFERDSEEMRIIHSHSALGAELLSGMNMSQIMVEMAHHHHIKADTSLHSSYPSEVKFKDVKTEARLLAIVDVYQALIGKRDYKKSWSPPKATQFIESLAGIEYDNEIWRLFRTLMGDFPIGSLVELSDSSLAFVVTVPEKELNRPQVALVRNSKGEDLEHNTLIDLSRQKDLSIEKSLDQYEVLHDNGFDIFTNLNIS